MKKLITILGTLVLIGAIAVPVIAWGPGWGRGGGHPMMGQWGSSEPYRGDYGNLTDDQKSELEALDRKFFDETKDLHNQIWNKSRELGIALDKTDPDLEKARALQREISELRAQLDDKSLTHELEIRKISPDRRYGYGRGGGYGSHMGSYGHRMGYGPGYCWN